ncbi:MAG: hypothetical protein COC01_08585 [Bacteroidetes bacterium]|nr:MAG: hypothetical protein COC01_08585 [Bacteroidota bacterium]
MKTFVFAIVLSFFSIISCAQDIYQIQELSSSNVQSDGKSFVYQDDVVSVSYDFWGDNGIAHMTIYNKSSNSIIVDWGFSHFVDDGLSRDYYNYITRVVATAAATTSKYLGQTSNTSHIVSSKKITAPKRYIHIPPKAFIGKQFEIGTLNAYYTCDYPFNISTLSDEGIQLDWNTSNKRFRNYITYYTDDLMKNKKIIDNDFYVGKVYSVKEEKFKKKEKRIVCDIDGIENAKDYTLWLIGQPNRIFIHRNVYSACAGCLLF